MKTKPIFFCFIIALALTVMPFADPARGDEFDLFDEMEEEAGTSSGSDMDLFGEMETDTEVAAPSRFHLITQLGKNLGGSARIRYMRYLRGVEDRDNADLKNDHYDYILRFDTYTAGDIWRVDIDGWAEGGNQSHTYAGVSHWFQDTQRDIRRHLEINELYLTFNQESYDVTVGKKIFTNKISTLFSPADRLRPQDSHDPLDPKDIGIWQAKIDYYLDPFTITGAFLPVYVAPKNPHNSSRWTGSTKDQDNRDYEFSDNSDVEEDYPVISGDNLSYFGRVKTTRWGWDFFASVYHGLNPYSVLKEETRNGETVRVKKSVKVGNYAAGFSTTYKKWELHGELLYNHSYNGKDDNYFNGVAGFTYSIDDWAKKIFLENIDITLEYAREFETRAQFADNFVESSSQNRAGQNEIFARVHFKYDEDLSFDFLSNFEFEDEGRYNHFESNYRFSSNLTWTLGIEAFNGTDNSYYGRWWRNDRIITSITYEF